MTDTNGHTPHPVVDPPRPTKLGRLELPQDLIDEIEAFRRMRRDPNPSRVVAEGVELLRRTYFEKKGRGK